MKSMFKGLLAALLVMAAPSLMAATIADEIVLGTGDFIAFNEGAFDENEYTLLIPINFTSEHGTFTATASSVPFNLNSLTLYTSDGDYGSMIDPVAVGALDGETATGDTTYFNWALSVFLTQGNYLLELVGNGPGSVHGSVSAVPLPGAAILFGTALLGAGVVGRRRMAANRAEAIPA